MSINFCAYLVLPGEKHMWPLPEQCSPGNSFTPLAFPGERSALQTRFHHSLMSTSTQSVLLGAEHGGGGGSLAHPWQMMWIKIPGTKGTWVQAMWVWANTVF